MNLFIPASNYGENNQKTYSTIHVFGGAAKAELFSCHKNFSPKPFTSNGLGTIERNWVIFKEGKYVAVLVLFHRAAEVI